MIFQDGQVTVEEFKQAIQKHCVGKNWAELPGAFKTFISSTFKTIDVNGRSFVVHHCSNHQFSSITLLPLTLFALLFRPLAACRSHFYFIFFFNTYVTTTEIGIKIFNRWFAGRPSNCRRIQAGYPEEL